MSGPFKVSVVIDGNATSAQAALRGTAKEAKAASQSVADMQARAKLLDAALEEVRRDAAGAGKDFISMRASMDGAYAAALKFDKSLTAVGSELKEGRIDAKAYEAALVDLKARHVAMIGGIDGLNGGVAKTSQVSAEARNNMKMFAYQINQVGQMGAVTGQWMQAMLIQIPDMMAVAGGLPGVIAGGAIAIGASLIPALFRGGDSASAMAEDIKDLTSALDALDEMSSVSSNTLDEFLTFSFRESAGAVRELLDALQDARFSAAMGQFSTALSSARGEVDRYIGAWDRADEIGMDRLRATAAEGNSVSRELLDLMNGSGGDADQLRSLQDALGQVAIASSDDEFVARLAEARSLAADIGGELGTSVIGALERIAVEAGVYSRTMKDAASSTETAGGKAREMLADLEQQNALAATAARWGEDSVQVAEMRAAAEHEALLAQIDALVVSDDLKAQLTAAADEAYRLALADIASPISTASAQATALANELSRAVGQLQALQNQSVTDLQIAQINAATVGDPVGRAGMLAGARFDAAVPEDTPGFLYDQMGIDAQRAEVVANARQTAALQQATSEREAALRRTSQGGGGGRGGAAKAERDAVADLVNSLQDQIDIIRATDPVQKEMLQNREALAEATSAERAQVEALIETRIQEEDALDRLQEGREDFRRTMYDEIKGLLFEGNSILEMLDNMIAKFAEMALQAALLGEGPLGGLFGGAGKGGGLGMIFDGLGGLLGFESGGYTGGGHPSAVAGVVHKGEFVFDAPATRRIGVGALEAIRAGRMSGYASGGLVAGRAAPAYGGSMGGASGVTFAPRIFVENQSSTPVTGEVEETTGPGGQRSFKLVLADQVGEALTQRGGGARKVLRSHGVRPPTVRR